MPNLKRIFISIEVPKAIKESIGDFVKLIPNLQPHPTDNFHITVKFIGEVDDTRLEEIKNILSDITAHAPHFQIGFEGLKFEESRLRFLVKDPGPILTLRSTMEEKFKKINLIHEDPLRYEPHITLGKIKMPPVQKPAFDYDSLIFIVNNIVLFETVRGEKTAQFDALKEFTLH